MSLSTYLRFLVGWREATERTAGARGGLDLGLLFVIISGLAGALDRVDLSYETWRVLAPLGVSLAAIAGLYSLVALLAWGRGLPVTWRRRSLRSLIVCYWLTEPIFWLHAIPFDRFLSPTSAVDAHAWLVAATMTWRVFVLARCVALLFRFRMWEALCPVMVVANLVLLSRLHWAELPTVELVKVVRQSDAVVRQLNLGLATALAAVVFLPLWSIGAAVTVWTGRQLKRPVKWLAAPRQWAKERVARHMFRLAGVILVGWIGLLMAGQPAKFRATQVERLIATGQVDAALAQLSTVDRDDLPRWWEPPPQLGRGQFTPPLGDILRRAKRNEVAPWVRRVYGEAYTFHFEAADADARRSAVGRWVPEWLCQWVGRRPQRLASGSSLPISARANAAQPGSSTESEDAPLVPPKFDLLTLDDDQLTAELELLEALTPGPKIAATYVARIDALLAVAHAASANSDPAQPNPSPALSSRRIELLKRFRDLGVAEDR